MNGLIELINNHLSNIDNPDQHPPTAASSALVEPEGSISDYVVKHFRNTLYYLDLRKHVALAVKENGELEPGLPYDEIDTSFVATS